MTSNWCNGNVSKGVEEFFGNMVGDAFLSAMVVTREFGLIREFFHVVFQSAIS